MKEILFKYFRGQALTIKEASDMILEYMQCIEVKNDEVFNWMFSQTNPFSQGLIQHAVNTSAKHLAVKYEIVRLFDKENKLLMVK
jgi:hypothetical protein